MKIELEIDLYTGVLKQPKSDENVKLKLFNDIQENSEYFRDEYVDLTSESEYATKVCGAISHTVAYNLTAKSDYFRLKSKKFVIKIVDEKRPGLVLAKFEIHQKRRLGLVSYGVNMCKIKEGAQK